MSKVNGHPYASFAARYADPTQSYLNAFIALERANSLTEDAEMLGESLNYEGLPSSRWRPWFGAEIVSYYAVGYITCLEWHARSRVVDLLTFNPGVRLDEFRGQISDKLIVEMLGQNASVSHLVGASINVSSLDRYFSLLGRILGHFGMKSSIGDWLTGSAEGAKVCWISPFDMEMLEYLFTFRNSLVHEIGSNVMGHFNIRDSWDPREAVRMGRVVSSLIRGIESLFTRVLPKEFPNKLDESFYPVNPLEVLKEELSQLEALADREIRKAEWDQPDTVELWHSAQKAAQVHLEAEEMFIERAEMLHWRYWDARFPLRLNGLKARKDFLRELLKNFSSANLDPNGEDLTGVP